MKSRFQRLPRLFILGALLLALSLPALAHERGDRDRHHGHEPGTHWPVAVPAGVKVPTWEELSPEQRKYLGRHEADWDTLPASRRVHALERAERRARWEAMPPEQRERIRKGMRNYRDMSPEQREKMRESMRVMRSLPAEQRDALARQWRALDPEQRRAWLETGGPGISPPPGSNDD
ncbi:DUF3106 domain-containing protein [Arenimonas aestuarii]